MFSVLLSVALLCGCGVQACFPSTDDVREYHLRGGNGRADDKDGRYARAPPKHLIYYGSGVVTKSSKGTEFPTIQKVMDELTENAEAVKYMTHDTLSFYKEQEAVHIRIHEPGTACTTIMKVITDAYVSRTKYDFNQGEACKG